MSHWVLFITAWLFPLFKNGSILKWLTILNLTPLSASPWRLNYRPWAFAVNTMDRSLLFPLSMILIQKPIKLIREWRTGWEGGTEWFNIKCSLSASKRDGFTLKRNQKSGDLAEASQTCSLGRGWGSPLSGCPGFESSLRLTCLPVSCSLPLKSRKKPPQIHNNQKTKQTNK